jgi:hypothetical protein
MFRSAKEGRLVKEVLLTDKRPHLKNIINSVPPSSFYGNHKVIMKQQQQSLMTTLREEEKPDVTVEDLSTPGIRKSTRTSGKTTTTTTTKPMEQQDPLEYRENHETGYDDETSTRFNEDYRLKRKSNKNKTYRKNARWLSREIEEEENEDIRGANPNNNNNHGIDGTEGGPHGIMIPPPSRREGTSTMATGYSGGGGRRGRGRKVREYRKSKHRETHGVDEVEEEEADDDDEEENDGRRYDGNEDHHDIDEEEEGGAGRRGGGGRDNYGDDEGEEDDEEEEEEGYEEEDENFIGEGDEDTERRRREAVQFMGRIEKEFDQLKDRLYVEKLASLNKDIEQLMDGTLPDFNEQLHALERRRKERLKTIESFYEYQLLCLKLRQECEAQQTEQDYVNDRDSLHERMLAALQERKRKLEEEKMNMDISSMELTAEDRTQTRKLRRRGMEPLLDAKAVKKKIISGPQFVQQLLDSEILEDLYIIRKSLNPTATRRSTTSKKT